MEKKIDREEFERHFKQVNASWGYEGAEIDEKGKELIFKRLNGEITEEEFNRLVAEKE